MVPLDRYNCTVILLLVANRVVVVRLNKWIKCASHSHDSSLQSRFKPPVTIQASSRGYDSIVDTAEVPRTRWLHCSLQHFPIGFLWCNNERCNQRVCGTYYRLGHRLGHPLGHPLVTLLVATFSHRISMVQQRAV